MIFIILSGELRSERRVGPSKWTCDMFEIKDGLGSGGMVGRIGEQGGVRPHSPTIW